MKVETRKITTLALLIALNVVLGNILSIDTQLLKINFAFIPMIVMGMLFGPWWTAVGAGLADIIGITLFNKGAPFFFGFTISAMITGLIYGVFFYKKEITWKNAIGAIVSITIIVNLILTPIWLAWMYNIPLNSWAIWAPRLIKTALWLPIQVLITLFIGRVLPYKQWQRRFS